MLFGILMEESLLVGRAPTSTAKQLTVPSGLLLSGGMIAQSQIVLEVLLWARTLEITQHRRRVPTLAIGPTTALTPFLPVQQYMVLVSLLVRPRL
jgi:hypothetical protein